MIKREIKIDRVIKRSRGQMWNTKGSFVGGSWDKRSSQGDRGRERGKGRRIEMGGVKGEG